MHNVRWPGLLPAVLAAAAAWSITGLASGEAYERFLAAQMLVERGPVPPNSPAAMLWQYRSGTYAHLVDIDSRYYSAESPLHTWLASPLYALGALVATVEPGKGWEAAFTSLLGPLLLLAMLLGISRLIRQQQGPREDEVAAVLLATLATPLLSSASVNSAWMAPAALLVWLMAGAAWAGRVGSTGHGMIAGSLVVAQPWLAPIALVGLAAGRRDWVWRSLGAVIPLVLLAGWQLAVFGKSWRLAMSSPSPPLMLLSLALTLTVLALHLFEIPWLPPWTILVVWWGLVLVPGPEDGWKLLLAGPLAVELGNLAGATLRKRHWFYWYATMVLILPRIYVSVILLERRPAIELMIGFSAEQRLTLALLVLLVGTWLVLGRPLPRQFFS